MKKHNPLPITSFVEDDFEIGVRPKARQKVAQASLQKQQRQQKQQKALQQSKVSPELLHRLAITGIRVTMTVAAFALAFWLFSLINSLIDSQQFRRFHTPAPVYVLHHDYCSDDSSLFT